MCYYKMPDGTKCDLVDRWKKHSKHYVMDAWMQEISTEELEVFRKKFKGMLGAVKSGKGKSSSRSKKGKKK